MRPLAQVPLLLLAVLACSHTGLAKVFEISWDTPSDGLIMPSVSTAKCGDVVRFKCPKNATHGVFRMTSVDGSCPESFDLPSAGVVLSAPSASCDFSLTLGDEPDFFVTSQAPGACHKNMKMNIHSVCPQGVVGAVTASSVMGLGGPSNVGAGGGLLGGLSSWSSGVVGAGGFLSTTPSVLPGAALPGQGAALGLQPAGGNIALQQVPDASTGGSMEAGSVDAQKSSAGGARALPVLGALGAGLAAAALAL